MIEPANPRPPPSLPAGRALVGLSLCLVVPSIMVVHKYAGLTGALVYALVVPTALTLSHRFGLFGRLAALPPRLSAGLAGATFVILVALFTVLYPIANSGAFGGGSDNDDALEMATRALLAGRYPYYQRTYLDAPISPMPGLLLLATPIVLLGHAAYASMLSLLMLGFVAHRRTGSLGSALGLLWALLVLSPTVLRDVVTGSDYIFNAACFLALFHVILTERASVQAVKPGRPLWKLALSATLLGLALSSRINFAPTLPLLLSGLAARRSLRFAAGYAGAACLVALAVTLPFYLYDPAGFSPLHTLGKLTRFDRTDAVDRAIPFAGSAVMVLTASLSIILALRRGNDRFEVLCRRTAAVLALPVVGGVVLQSIQFRAFVPHYSKFGIFFLPFGAQGFWSELCPHPATSHASASSAEVRQTKHVGP